ncbi:DUF1513 domain-containing protein [Rhodobacteraceae bacterium NNCM2]|nr:DUF1513 domain-containing protein [Coraliihabitans acroporae]
MRQAPRLSRRGFLIGAGSGATLALGSGASWADAGSPAYVAAAKSGDAFRLLGMSAAGEIAFDRALPARGHAAAVHPSRAEVVAFARRPGTFALIIDCATGQLLARLDSPAGRHFYGHGAFSADGTRLYTTENAFDDGTGVIGIWDAADGYRRVGEVPSGGIGPHDVLRLGGTETLVIANGGIRTHPAEGREKLNIPNMAPNLTYIDGETGRILDQVEPPADLRLNSIRHLAQAPGGTVASAMQWQGDPADGVPLLAFHRLGAGALRIAEGDELDLMAMNSYAGSIAFDASGSYAAITSPRGGRVMAWSTEGAPTGFWARSDVCGLAAAEGGWTATDGLGGVVALGTSLAARPLKRLPYAFDNHLVPV